jgi:hypothetical protein
MDGTGVPMVSQETVGRKGKTDGQPAHTREVKLGCVSTQSTWDTEGYAIRDPDSTTLDHGGVRQAHLSGSLERWLELRAKESCHRRRILSLAPSIHNSMNVL